MTKIQLFIENAKLLSKKFGITPLLYGSLGLEFLTGCSLESVDIDILIPKTYTTDRWGEFCDVMESNSYVLIDEHEHTFEKDGICYSYAQIEELSDFAGIKVDDIKTKTDCGTEFLLLSLRQYLKVYLSSIKDGYRIQVRNKKEAEKIAFIRELLKGADYTIEKLDPKDYNNLDPTTNY